MHTPYIDLHLHSTVSDGALTPSALLSRAREAGIRILSLTDHNHTGDLSVLRQRNPDLQLIQGVEISCFYPAPWGKEVALHVIGLGFDPDNPKIQEVLRKNQPDRRPYVNAILDRLRQCGIDLGDYGDILRKNPHSKHIGRKQIAQVLQQEGYVRDVDEAFDTYIGGFGKKLAFVENPLRYVSLEEAVAAILDAGGIPVLCHLYYYGLEPERQDTLLRYFKSLTGDKGAMEVFYGPYSRDLQYSLLEKSRQFGLMASAASDFHGQNENETLDHKFPCSCCAALLEQLGVSPGNVHGG